MTNTVKFNQILVIILFCIKPWNERGWDLKTYFDGNVYKLPEDSEWCNINANYYCIIQRRKRIDETREQQLLWSVFSTFKEVIKNNYRFVSHSQLMWNIFNKSELNNLHNAGKSKPASWQLRISMHVVYDIFPYWCFLKTTGNDKIIY